MRPLPTPPASSAPLEEQGLYLFAALAWVAENVEQAETRGLQVAVQFPFADGHVQVRAYFCLGCDRLHLESSTYDQDGRELAFMSYDPDAVRASVRS